MTLTFGQWMKQVNRIINQRIGLSVYDLADKPYRDWFDSELTPQEAAIETLEDEGLEGFEEEA